MMAWVKTSLVAACMIGAASAAMAAPVKHREHLIRGHHAPGRALEPRFNPYAYGFQPYGYGSQPYSWGAQERWFDQAKGNIW
jgi:hypothetical protein